MKISNIAKFGLVWLVLGLELSIIQLAKAQGPSNPPALFQYAIFYNGLLEFSDCATLTINGRVQCNSNIYLGTPSSSTVTFNGFVTASGTITSPPNVGISQSSWTGTNKFNATPTPGWESGFNIINLPIGTNSYYELINLPNASDSPSNSLSQQRYYYKADLVILVTNTTPTNVTITVMVKNSMFDSTPIIYSVTNGLATNTASYTNMLTNWNNFGASYWLSTISSFWDARQGQTNHVTQIDLGNFF